MIVSYSTFEAAGVGFRERLFRPRWLPLKKKLRELEPLNVPPIDVRFIIDKAVSGREVSTRPDGSLLVVVRVPWSRFCELRIEEKNQFLLLEIATSIEYALSTWGHEPSSELRKLLGEMRGASSLARISSGDNPSGGEI